MCVTLEPTAGLQKHCSVKRKWLLALEEFLFETNTIHALSYFIKARLRGRLYTRLTRTFRVCWSQPKSDCGWLAKMNRWKRKTQQLNKLNSQWMNTVCDTFWFQKYGSKSRWHTLLSRVNLNCLFRTWCYSKPSLSLSLSFPASSSS